MKKVLVLVAVSFCCWLSCKKTDTTTPVEKPCVRTYDSTTTIDSYTERDSLNTFFGTKTLDFKLKIVRISNQTGTCDIQPICSNLLTITNNTAKTVTIFYTIVGGSNVMIMPNSVKEQIVPTEAYNTPCVSLGDLKANVKVRYN